MWNRSKDPDSIAIGWLDEVQRIASPAFIKVVRVNRNELRLKVIPNPAHARYLEKKKQKQAALAAKQQEACDGKTTTACHGAS